MSLSVSKWLIGCCSSSCRPYLLAADWPQWRGPNRDGVTRDFVAPTTWPATLKETWKMTVGEGHSSPVTSEGRIYVLARQGEDEVVLCLEAATGKQLWRASYPAAYTMNPAATGHGKGPKSTPVVSGGKLFTFGINGVLSCFDAKSGKLHWRKEFSKQYPNTSPLYGTAMSPIVANGLCIVHVGGHDKGALTAFEVETGAVKWANTEDGPAYSSPVLATLAGEPQLVTYTQSNVVGISATTGKLLWKMANKVPYDVNSVSPVVYKDLVIFSIYEKGVGADPAVEAGRPVGCPGGLAECGLRVVYEHPRPGRKSAGWVFLQEERVSSSAWTRTPGKCFGRARAEWERTPQS